MSSRASIMPMSNVPLPSTIPCSECRKHKPKDSYSAKRLDDLSRHILKCTKERKRFDPKTTGFIRCTLCLGGPSTEHKCFNCNVTYPRGPPYFNKTQLRQKDKALCSKCSEDQVNDRLSDSSGGDKESDGSAASFGTNPFQFNDDDSSVSGMSKMTISGTSSTAFDNSSGGVTLPNSQTGRGGGSTIYGGPSTSAGGSLRSTTNPPSSATFSSTPSTINRAVSSAVSDAASIKSTSTFNPNRYGNPGRRSPTSSVTSSRTSTFAKVGAKTSKVNMEAARQQEKSMAQAIAAKEEEVYVADSSESEGEPVSFAMPGSSTGKKVSRLPAVVDSDDDDAPFNG